MRLANVEDFEEGGLYWPPMTDYPWYAKRAADLNGRFFNGSTLVVGCGYGYTVEHGLELGMDIWGCDAAQYAVDKAQQVLTPAAAARITLGDATDSGSMNAVRSFCGLKGGQKFAGVVTEDMLGALTLAEVQTALPILRGLTTSNVLHVITCSKDNDRPGMRDPSLLWMTQSEWKALVAPDLVLDAETGIIV